MQPGSASCERRSGTKLFFHQVLYAWALRQALRKRLTFSNFGLLNVFPLSLARVCWSWTYSLACLACVWLSNPPSCWIWSYRPCLLFDCYTLLVRSGRSLTCRVSAILATAGSTACVRAKLGIHVKAFVCPCCIASECLACGNSMPPSMLRGESLIVVSRILNGFRFSVWSVQQHPFKQTDVRTVGSGPRVV